MAQAVVPGGRLMAARRKPGVSIPESDRHTVQRKIRLTPSESAALDSVADARGVNVSRAVGALANDWWANNAPPPVRPNARRR